MKVHPTRSTFQVALGGAGLVALGCAARLPHVVAFGCAMVLAVAIGRAAALLAITRLRAAGFEMVWAERERTCKAVAGEPFTVAVELRNRSPEDVRGVRLRALASSLLDVHADPEQVDLPAGSRVRVLLRGTGKRVGRWGLHGVALEVRGLGAAGEALYEVPLMFANPFGVEVLPKALEAFRLSPRGGRSRHASQMGRPAAMSGDGEELRELRGLVPGDPFKRIAWKASARRGQLLVREMERDERDVVWLVVDASVELWAGAPGQAPLDRVVEEVASLAARHLGFGDSVGLAVYASRIRTWLAPTSGATQAGAITAALVSAASMVDADRCELDEAEVAARVAEHARPLDARGLEDVRRNDFEALSARAEQLRSRAPFAARLPQGRTPREQKLRLYLACFGIEVPPRLEGEREKAGRTLVALLDRLGKDKPKPSVVYVIAPAPQDVRSVDLAVRRLRRGRAEIRWVLPPLDAALGEAAPPTTVGAAVIEAVRARVSAAQRREVLLLRKMGVKLASPAWYPAARAGRARAAS